jgi:predicted nucleotidyltransferase
MGLKFRLEEILGRDVDLVLKDALKPRLRPIIEKQVRYV